MLLSTTKIEQGFFFCALMHERAWRGPWKTIVCRMWVGHNEFFLYIYEEVRGVSPDNKWSMWNCARAIGHHKSGPVHTWVFFWAFVRVFLGVFQAWFFFALHICYHFIFFTFLVNGKLFSRQENTWNKCIAHIFHALPFKFIRVKTCDGAPEEAHVFIRSTDFKRHYAEVWMGIIE